MKVQKKYKLTNKKGTMQKLKNKLDDLLKIEEENKVKQQQLEQVKLKGLYETLDFVPLPQDLMDNANTDWED